jgi:hypothetical protein
MISARLEGLQHQQHKLQIIQMCQQQRAMAMALAMAVLPDRFLE